MKTIVEYTYVSDDGMEFKNELECMRHEFNTLYKEGFVKFYSKDGYIEEPINKDFDDIGFYNSVIRIEIDRSQPEKIQKICDMSYDYYGFVLFADAFNGAGNTYIWYDKGDITDWKFVEEKP